MASPCLSNPAARPIGFERRLPKICVVSKEREKGQSSSPSLLADRTVAGERRRTYLCFENGIVVDNVTRGESRSAHANGELLRCLWIERRLEERDGDPSMNGRTGIDVVGDEEDTAEEQQGPREEVADGRCGCATGEEGARGTEGGTAVVVEEVLLDDGRGADSTSGCRRGAVRERREAT